MERFTKHWEFKVCEVWEGADVVESIRCRAIVTRNFLPYHKLLIASKPLELRAVEGEKEDFKFELD